MQASSKSGNSIIAANYDSTGAPPKRLNAAGSHWTARHSRPQPPDLIHQSVFESIDISSFAGGEPLTVMEQIPQLRSNIPRYQEVFSNPLKFDIGHGQSFDQVLGRMSTDKPFCLPSS